MRMYQSHGFAPPQAPADPIDRLQKLQNLDTAQAQSDVLRQTGSMNMLKDLYGIQHEQQMQPEQLRALAASTAARQFETNRGEEMLPEQLRGLRGENTSREFQNAWAQPNMEAENALKTAQASNLQANADATRKYDVPALHDLMLMHQTGMPDTDFYTALGKVPGMQDVSAGGLKRISDAEAARTKARAEEEARTNPQSALKSTIPQQYQSDPEIQHLLQQDAKSQNYYKPGGELDLQMQREKLNRQVHPFIQGIKDLWNLYS